jgi:hypothetical protein
LSEDGEEAAELVEMGGGQCGEAPIARRRQPEPDDSMVLGVQPALDQPSQLRPIYQPDNTVMSQEQVLGHLTDGGRAAFVAADGEEELVLSGSHAGIEGVLLAPAEKTP